MARSVIVMASVATTYNKWIKVVFLVVNGQKSQMLPSPYRSTVQFDISQQAVIKSPQLVPILMPDNREI